MYQSFNPQIDLITLSLIWLFLLMNFLLEEVNKPLSKGMDQSLASMNKAED